ncbi:MAG: hypothetical protein HOO90_10255 [Methylotenera sp.]|nr:hypothetical protein [Methylotenera sp.]
MTKLFKTKPVHEKRTIRYPILMTEKEAETIRHSALIGVNAENGKNCTLRLFCIA